MARKNGSADNKRRRQKFQMRFGLILALLAMLAIVVTIGIRSLTLREQLDGYNSQKATIEAQIATEQKRTDEIDDYRKYLETDQAVEEIARDRLGLVKKNTILFRNEDAN